MLKAKNLKKNFEVRGRQLEIIKGIDLEIRSGEFVALVGKSGSGKSTLLSLLAGLDRPSSGQIFYNDIEIQNLDEDGLSLFRRDRFGFVFQSYHLIPTLTALENILIPYQLAARENGVARAQGLLDKVGLKDRADHYPKQMSGGEQQRVSICRALMNEPEILFADEPTGNLDSANGETVLQLLVDLRGSQTLVLVTHDFDVAARADRILEIVDGRVVSKGMSNASATILG